MNISVIIEELNFFVFINDAGYSPIIIIIIIIPYYKYIPANVLENENVKLYWNRSILTNKTIVFNRSDKTFMNKKTNNAILIDIAVPNTHNLAKTITDKQNNFQELANGNMCYVEAKGSTSDSDSNVIYGSNSKVTITKSNKS